MVEYIYITDMVHLYSIHPILPYKVQFECLFFR